MWSILIWCTAHKPEFAATNFFLVFSRPVYSRCIVRVQEKIFLLACHILSGCREKFGVNYGQSLEMGP